MRRRRVPVGEDLAEADHPADESIRWISAAKKRHNFYARQLYPFLAPVQFKSETKDNADAASLFFGMGADNASSNWAFEGDI